VTREVVLQMQMSLDGFVGAADGNVDWAFPAFDDAFTAWSVESLWQAGTHVMGAETGRGLAEYWPNPTEPRDLPFAAPMNEIPKVVFSRSIDRLDWNQTRIARGDLTTEIASLKAEDGKHVLVHGGASFAQSLIRLGLIDEYQLVVHPVVLGSGQPLFPEMPAPLRMRVEAIRPFPSGAALQVLRPVPGQIESNEEAS
jgi:dihydrofolate reductase